MVYRERIEFGNPKTIDEVVRNARLCYQKFKSKGDGSKFWQNKDREKPTVGIKRHTLGYLQNFVKDHERKKSSKMPIN